MTKTSGTWLRTCWHSVGSSSRNARLSTPMFNSSAMARRFSALSVQLMRIAAKWLGLRSIPAWFFKASRASSRLFLLQIASRIPR